MSMPLFHPADPNLPRRNEIYLRILHLGLLHIRGVAYQGAHRRCEIEADHLHNIPAYIAAGDTAHHLFYLAKEVPLYLTRIDPNIPADQDLLQHYIPLWRELQTLIPIQGSPWEHDWLALRAAGWDYATSQ